MTIERKVGMGIAGQPSGGATDVADVFSTDLYTGDDGNVDITNGIDLAGEGGMVWLKSRSAYPHTLWSSETTGNLVPNSTDPINNAPLQPTFNSDGFTFPNNATYNGWVTTNSSSHTYASWTFRKKEKFFDVVTYTGNSGTSQTIAHGLNGPVGMILVKAYAGASASQNWMVFHAGNGATKYQVLNDATAAATATSVWNDTAPTDTHFTVGSDSSVNNSNKTYVAYLFADNSSEDADDQMIKCGSYTGTGGSGVTVNLGWEAQWVMVKKSSATSDWKLMDNMRGMPTPSGGRSLKANDSAAEGGDSTIRSDSRGFTIYPGSTFDASGTYIYMAIRAPMMKEPEAATDVFGITTRNVANDNKAPEFRSTFPVDMAMKKWDTTDPTLIVSRLNQGKSMQTSTTSAEVNFSSAMFDYNNGWSSNATGANTTLHSWMWKRAKGYMDVVCDTRAFTYGTLNHSLGVVPELIIKKNRSRASTLWDVMPNVSPYDYRYTFYLNDTQAINGPSGSYWQTAPTDTVFGVNYSGDGSSNGDTFIYYLFATLAGISKVGSYTGNGSSQTISCGFSAGSRYILIKRTDASGDWYVWDSVRGIVSGNDPHFSLNTNAGDVTNDDSVDPHNSGFIVNQVSATNINVSSGTYIFYAIA